MLTGRYGAPWRIVPAARTAFLVNSACHVRGARSRESGDDGRNHWLVALLTLGEGWHNHHRRFGYAARRGLEWWQLDVTWLTLKVMAAVGLVRDLRLPRRTAAAVAA